MMGRVLCAFAWLVLAAGYAVPAAAKVDSSADFRLIREGEPVQLRADRAYILLRVDSSITGFAADILRVPDQSELDVYEAAKLAAREKASSKAPPIESFPFDYKGRPNLYGLEPKKSLMRRGTIVTMLAEVTPGDYVFYGIGPGNGGRLYECMCFGTVGFAARPGQITDLGTMLTAIAAKPSPIPELAGEVNLGPSATPDYVLFAVALRPQRAGDDLPDAVDVTKILPAQFKAVGPFVEPNTLLVNRLAPVPGVLTYNAGRVIDVPSGQELP